MTTFEMSANTNWIPYKIPRTPSAAPPANTTYALGLSGVNSSKNPSQFLEWKEIATPDLTEILARIATIENRLNNASVSASCQGGSLDITLNI